MYTNPPSEGDKLISRYGVRFEEEQNGGKTPVLYILGLSESGDAIWTEVSRSMTLATVTPAEEDAIASSILAHFVTKFAKKRVSLSPGDRVFHTRMKISGKLKSINGKEAVMDINGVCLNVHLKELRKDRKS